MAGMRRVMTTGPVPFLLCPFGLVRPLLPRSPPLLFASRCHVPQFLLCSALLFPHLNCEECYFPDTSAARNAANRSRKGRNYGEAAKTKVFFGFLDRAKMRDMRKEEEIRIFTPFFRSCCCCAYFYSQSVFSETPF